MFAAKQAMPPALGLLLCHSPQLQVMASETFVVHGVTTGTRTTLLDVRGLKVALGPPFTSPMFRFVVHAAAATAIA